MGCDIHLYTERFDPEGNCWRFVPGDDVDYLDNDETRPGPWWVDRNYTLFGVLAGVRVQDYEPIAEGRGLPSNLSPEMRENYQRERPDAHSMAWMLLSEVKAYDWNQSDGDTHVYPHEAKLSKREQVLIALGGHPLRGRCKQFFDQITKIEALGAPEQIRLVMWFDN